MHRILSSTILAIMTLCFAAAAAVAQTPNCGGVVLNSSNHSVTVSPSANIANYNPFTNSVSISITVSVARNNLGVNAACRLGLYIEGGRTTKTLANGANVLNYEMRNGQAGPSILYPAGAAVGSGLIFFTLGRNQSLSATISYEIPASQFVPAGLYEDPAIQIVTTQVNNASTPSGASARRPMATSATVVKACRLGTPSPSTLSFLAGDIPNGLPNEGVIKQTNMAADCTAPTRVRLTGQALTNPAAPSAPANFDNFLNYRADVSFGAANSVLTTTPSPQTIDSSAYSSASGTTSSGNVSVNVNLKQGRPAVAGTYTGTLTVTLDPNL